MKTESKKRKKERSTKRLTQMPRGNLDRRVSLRFLILDSLKGLASAKQQRNTPNTGKSYYRVDDAGEERGLSTADPCNDVKLKQSDAAPVESTYDGQNQRNAIQYHHDRLLF